MTLTPVPIVAKTKHSRIPWVPILTASECIGWIRSQHFAVGIFFGQKCWTKVWKNVGQGLEPIRSQNPAGNIFLVKYVGKKCWRRSRHTSSRIFWHQNGAFPPQQPPYSSEESKCAYPPSALPFFVLYLITTQTSPPLCSTQSQTPTP